MPDPKPSVLRYGYSRSGGIHIRDLTFPRRGLCWVLLTDGDVNPDGRHVCGNCQRIHEAREGS